MFRTSSRRAMWYVNRDLATIEAEVPHLVIKLTFKPRGRGSHSFYCQKKENICVVCGGTNELSKHHVVPYCFRRYFPNNYKSSLSFDVMPLCEQCHNKYERIANLKKKVLEKVYNAEGYKSVCIMARHASSYRNLLNNDIPLPESRRKCISERLLACKQFLLERGFVLDESNVLSKTEPDGRKNSIDCNYRMGEIIVSQIENYDVFIKEWRQHFLETMKPQFLPKGWTVDHPTSL